MDTVSPATRSRMMSRIRGKDTKPELAVRRWLHSRGFRFRIHGRDLPGRPDIVLPRRRAVVFVHGCFWHAHSCPSGRAPSSRADFWQAKFHRNRERDGKAVQSLLESGWRVAVVWECALAKGCLPDHAGRTLGGWLESETPVVEISGSGQRL